MMEMKGKPTRWSGKRHSMARIGRVRRSPKHIDNDTKESSPDGTLFPSLPCYMPLCVAEAPWQERSQNRGSTVQCGICLYGNVEPYAHSPRSLRQRSYLCLSQTRCFRNTARTSVRSTPGAHRPT